MRVIGRPGDHAARPLYRGSFAAAVTVLAGHAPNDADRAYGPVVFERLGERREGLANCPLDIRVAYQEHAITSKQRNRTSLLKELGREELLQVWQFDSGANQAKHFAIGCDNLARR